MDLLNPKYKDLYKSRRTPNVQKKGKRMLQDRRKEDRHTMLLNKRKISVTITPAKEKPPNPAELLREKLKLWKEEKKREAAARKAKEKPIFKVHHVSLSIGMPDLENVNKFIKGKPIFPPKKLPVKEKSSAKKKVDSKRPLKRQDGFDFGFNVSKAGPSNGIKAQVVNTKIDLPSPGGGIASRLRSRSKQDEQSNVQKTYKGRNKRTAAPVQMKKRTRNALKSDEVNEVVYRSPEKRPHLQLEKGVDLQTLDCATPTYPTTPTQDDLAKCYISPYVTISRGKTSARREFHKRISQGGLFDESPHLAKATGSQAGAAHFYKILDNEIARIENMCTDWLEYKDNQNPPEEAADMINMAVGQSNLLINKKFKQFRSLIKDCETNNTDRAVTCLDLHGYWETAYLQVENLNKRFENLENLRRNNWIEILPQIDIVQKPQKKKKVVRKPNKPKAQSTLKDLIKAQRQKVKDQAAMEEDITSLSLVKSPSSPMKSSRHNSLLASVVLNEARKRNSSPGFVMIKAAKIGRRSNEVALAVDDECTPDRTNMKTRRSKLTLQKSSPDVSFDLSSIGSRRWTVTHIDEPGSTPGNVLRKSRSKRSTRKSIGHTEEVFSTESKRTKGILRTPCSKSTTKKSVLFRSLSKPSDDNSPPIDDCINYEPKPIATTPGVRRSSRRPSQTKLTFND